MKKELMKPQMDRDKKEKIGICFLRSKIYLIKTLLTAIFVYFLNPRIFLFVFLWCYLCHLNSQ